MFNIDIYTSDIYYINIITCMIFVSFDEIIF